MMELRKRNSCCDGIGKGTERDKNESRSSCDSSCSFKVKLFRMQVTWADREMFALFRNQKISSNGCIKAKI